MGLYGSRSPKPHVGYANFRSVGRYNVGKMSKEFMAALRLRTQTTTRYRDKRGRVRFVGTAALKKTQLGTKLLNHQVCVKGS